MKTKHLLIALALISPLSCLAAAPEHPNTAETVIALLPVIFFFFILLITTVKLKRADVKLSDLLAEKDPPVGAPADSTTPPGTKSVSRFIAFLTALVALTIGVCICTFYMYVYFGNSQTKLDLSNLTNVIWGLGIGVIPYGFNKASSALKS